MARNWHQEHIDTRTRGERVADSVALGLGSWPFIIGQTAFVAVWMVLNVFAWLGRWDPYPFILLNLLFSVQAAYSAPIIMMSQNRAADLDRHQASADYDTNLRSEEEIEDLQRTLARIEIEKLDRILALLESEREIRGR